MTEATKRLGVGVSLLLVTAVFMYAGVTGERELPEMMLIILVAALSGFGAGYVLGK